MNGPFDRKRVPPAVHRRPVSPSPTAHEAATRPAPAAPAGRPAPTSTVSRSEEDEARSSSKYRAALEALFAPKQAAIAEPPPAAERSKKVVSVPSREDPRGPEREKRLAKLLAAEGRAAVTKAADDFTGAGFELPGEQESMLKLLDHDRDAQVRWALEGLARLLDAEPPHRRKVLEARLRRLEESADDAEVRALAGSLLKQVLSRGGH
jgi:hypothetical protein